MKLPAELKGRVWHTTSLVRFQQILRDQAILPEPPTVDNSERWKTGSRPELYPYVRVIGGVSLFDFRNFDEKEYSEKYPLSSYRLGLTPNYSLIFKVLKGGEKGIQGGYRDFRYETDSFG